MNRIVTCIIGLALCATVSAQEETLLNEIINLGLPTLIINTVDSEEPTCDYVDAPEGCIGTARVNDKKVYGSLVIVENGDTIYNSGEYLQDTSGISLRLTGNTSGQFSDIPPYKLKLEKKADLLNRNDAAFNDKDWRLIKGTSGAYNIAGFKFSELVEMDWTPEYKHCNLLLNGKYRGVYLLIEPVKRNSDCRIDVAKNGGYIVERDAYWWNENISFPSPFFEKDLYYRFTFKYPDEKDITDADIEYIKEYFGKAEMALFDNTPASSYNQFFDITSMAKWLMVHDILGTRDSGGSNMYFSKYDNTDASLLTMPVVWDLDSSFGVDTNSFSKIHNSSHSYFPYFLNHQNQSFIKEYMKQWQRITDSSVIESIINYLDTFYGSAEGQAVKKSREASLQHNYTDVTHLEQDITTAKEWLTAHKQWLDNTMPELFSSVCKINECSYASKTSDVFNITGQRIVPGSGKGIFIRNGKKYINH